MCRPLHLSATLVNVPEITYLLLDHGAEVDTRNTNEATPLFAACKANNPTIASKLIDCGESRPLCHNHTKLYYGTCTQALTIAYKT